jgi:hypothetical protein
VKTCSKCTEGGDGPINPQTNNAIHIVGRDRHLHTSYVEGVGGVPPYLSQCTEGALLSSLSRLGLHEMLETSRLNIGAGYRIEPTPPLEDLRGVTSRQEGTDNLYER